MCLFFIYSTTPGVSRMDKTMLIYLALLEKHLRIHVYIRYRKSREKDTMADINSISLCVFKFFFYNLLFLQI